MNKVTVLTLKSCSFAINVLRGSRTDGCMVNLYLMHFFMDPNFSPQPLYNLIVIQFCLWCFHILVITQ